MANTGYLIQPKLKKVTDDENEFPLDVNNNLCSVSGLPQDTMDNPIESPTYRILNTDVCPVPIVEDYTIGLYEEQSSGSGTIIQVYAELRDENNSPINATIDILSEGNWIKREISTGEETGVSSPINLTAGNSRINMFTYDATIEEIFGYAVSDVTPNIMDGHNIIGI